MTLSFLSFQNLDMIVGHVYCKVLFHYTTPVWKSTLLVIGIWNITYWGLHLCPQPTCMLFLLCHLWVLVHLNYRDIKQLSHKGGGVGGGSQAPPEPPRSYTPDEKKKFRHRLFTSSIKREIWHFLALFVEWWLKKCTKKACCTCRVVALPIHLYCLFNLLFVVAVVAS